MTRLPMHSIATLVVTYVVLTVAALLMGDQWLGAWLPLLAKQVDWLMPTEFARHALALTPGDGQITLEAVTTVDLHAANRIIPAGTVARSATLKAYALQHAAIVFAILAAWPARSLGKRAWLLALGAPCILLCVSFDIPFVLVGLLRRIWLDPLATGHATADPLVVYGAFLQDGGRIGLSIAVAVAAATTVSDPRAAATPVDGPDAAAAAK